MVGRHDTQSAYKMHAYKRFRNFRFRDPWIIALSISLLSDRLLLQLSIRSNTVQIFPENTATICLRSSRFLPRSRGLEPHTHKAFRRDLDLGYSSHCYRRTSGGKTHSQLTQAMSSSQHSARDRPGRTSMQLDRTLFSQSFIVLESWNNYRPRFKSP